ncbi:hypothetical protein C8Q76DRAFT_709730 [Earliella scabrosa]|nr:hypothetical protein C8Q76DRAFT_709730 [Earliella scabrosa]
MQCRTSCTILDTINTCANRNASCLCSISNHQSLNSCLQCAIQAESGALEDAQKNMQSYEETCQSLGVNLLPITLSQELSSNAYQACGPILQMLAAAGTTVAILTL